MFKQTLLSSLYYLFFLVSGVFLMIIALLLWLLTVLFDKRLFLLHQYTQWWNRFLFAVVPAWRIKVIGREKIDNKKVKVFVSNHQSTFDIVVVSKLFAHFKWVSKSEAFNFPIVGWVMRLNQYIPLKRGTRKGVLRMTRLALKTLADGSPIYIFPEGTRSLDGKVKRMSSGAFTMAQKAKVGVQPIVIDGTRHIKHRGDWKLHFKANITLEVLDEIPYEQIKDLSPSEVSDMVKKRISERLDVLSKVS